MKKTIVLAMATAVATSGFAISLNEGFDGGSAFPGSPLANGWSSLNVSPGGPGTVPNWVQITTGVFTTPHAGAGFAWNNFNASTGANDILNYMISPIDNIAAGDMISFMARSIDSVFPDRLRLMLSPTGGAAAANFTVTCLTINPGVVQGVFLNAWTKYSYTFTAADLGGPSANARVAFLYDTPNGGPLGNNADNVAIDTVTSTPVPEPATMTALALGIGALVARRRRK